MLKTTELKDLVCRLGTVLIPAADARDVLLENRGMHKALCIFQSEHS